MQFEERSVTFRQPELKILSACTGRDEKTPQLDQIDIDFDLRRVTATDKSRILHVYPAGDTMSASYGNVRFRLRRKEAELAVKATGKDGLVRIDFIDEHSATLTALDKQGDVLFEKEVSAIEIEFPPYQKILPAGAKQTLDIRLSGSYLAELPKVSSVLGGFNDPIPTMTFFGPEKPVVAEFLALDEVEGAMNWAVAIMPCRPRFEQLDNGIE